MAEPTRPEFEILDSKGLEYHCWIYDVETTFMGKDYISTIIPFADPNDEEPSDKVKENALMFMRWHIDQLTVQWNEICLLDYKRVNDFNKDMLRLKACLTFCGKEITEADMIQKTLSTFPTSALILAN
ncbi:uncharacterized protein LOC109842424 [Asparagus officinalis]|uniref:uncharacterized protein LOC109842424 n=1 Tax=Asparagus officinalis TaxID=4686 RepID=UPI00098E2E6E|nr:uncharacterized protein LOC109842424 [Asparagus officinalis]